jgi:hypothetical protein
MNRSAWTGFLIGAAVLAGVVLAVRAARAADSRAQLGEDTYNWLGALQPRITAPVIRMAPPNPAFAI